MSLFRLYDPVVVVYVLTENCAMAEAGRSNREVRMHTARLAGTLNRVTIVGATDHIRGESAFNARSVLYFWIYGIL